MGTRNRRSILTGLCGTAALSLTAACKQKSQPVDLIKTYPKVRDAMDELFRSVGSLQASVAVLGADTWQAMVPEIKDQTQSISLAASKIGMTLRFPG
jgi:isopentenyl diphosphate isomerase/L-lactate dehydrogenase-like FMN-dependent dehydrogenase